LCRPASTWHRVIPDHVEVVAARALGVRLQPLEARGPSEIDRAFAAMRRERAGAFLILLDPMLAGQRERIADLAARSRLPAMYALRLDAEAGGPYGLWRERS